MSTPDVSNKRSINTQTTSGASSTSPATVPGFGNVPSNFDDLGTALNNLQQSGGSSSLAGQTYQAGTDDGATQSSQVGAGEVPPDLSSQSYQQTTPGSQAGSGATFPGATSSTTSGGDGLGLFSSPPPGGSGTGADTVVPGTSSSGGATSGGLATAKSLIGALGTSPSVIGAGDDFAGLSVQAIVLKVLNEAYESTNKDALSYAKKVSFYNNVKSTIRDEQNRTRSALASAADSSNNDLGSNAFTASQQPITDFTGDDSVKLRSDSGFFADDNIDGSRADSAGTAHSGFGAGGQITTKSALSAYADKLQNDLDSVGDDSSKAQTELQQITSQAQQLLTAITQLIKNYNDTALSIIRNI